MKKGIFDTSVEKNNDKELVAPPWDVIHQQLFYLAPGAKIKIPTKRSDYEKIKEGLSGREDFRSKDVVSFIEFLFKHESLGNLEFEKEQWMH